MSSLFDPAKPDARLHPCSKCRTANAPCGMAGAWYCVACVPPAYWPKREGDR
jgi:hypothetical protein